MLRLVAAIQANEFGRKVLILMSGTALGQMAAALLSPVLTRLYSPEDFGKLSILMMVVAVLSVFTTLSFEFAIPVPPKDGDARALVGLALSLTISVSAVVAVVIVSFPQLLNALHLDSTLETLLIPISLAFAGGFAILNYWSIRQSAFHAISISKGVLGFSIVGIQILLGLVLANTSWGLLAGYVLGQFVALTCLFLLSKARPNFAALSLQGLYNTATQYRRFALVGTPAELTNRIGAQAPIFLIAQFYTPVEVGWLALTNRILQAPVMLISQSVAQAYTNEFSKLLRESDYGKMLPLFWRITHSQLIIAVVLFLPIGLISPFIFPTLFGSEWAVSGWFAAALAAAFAIQYVANCTGDTPYLIERQDLQMAREVVRLVLIGGTLWFIGSSGGSIYNAIVGLSIALGSFYLVYWLTTWYALDRFVGSKTAK